MITKEQIQRINELAKKSRTNGLNNEEKKEQENLRRLYIDSIKENLKLQLDNIKIVSPEEYERGNKEKGCGCGCNHNHNHHEEHECNCKEHKN